MTVRDFALVCGLLLLMLAGFNVRAPHFAPEWFGVAFLAVAFADLFRVGA